MHYFDNSSTTKVCDEAIKAMLNVMSRDFGNPSSVHQLGLRASKLLEKARENTAAALGCGKDEIYFTSGGTEADNWAIFSGVSVNRHAKHIVTTTIEHDAVLKAVEKLQNSGYEVTYLSPKADGAIAVEELEDAIRSDTAMVSMMLVNNETGVLQPVSEIRRIVKKKGSSALIHTDAVQGFLRVPLSTADADLISISSHKIHGPKGAGALYIRKGIKLPPFLVGGGQEGGMRSGTEALPAIVGFGEACRAAMQTMEDDAARMDAYRKEIIERLCEAVGNVVITGENTAPHILSLALPGYPGEVLMNYLESKNVFVSRGSACKKGKGSHVLTAMKLPQKVIDGTLRISMSRMTTREDVEALISALTEASRKIRHR